MASRPPQRVAIVYHGQYIRGTEDNFERDGNWNPLCTDFFSAAHNHYTALVQPMQRMGVQVLTAFHTYRSGCEARDQALVDFLQPVAYRFDDHSTFRRIVDSYILGIDLLNATGVAVDAIMAVRFEGWFRVNITSFDIAWDKINVAFRDSPFMWNAYRATSDLFFVVPWNLVDLYRLGLDRSGDVPQSWPGSGHFAYRMIEEAGGADQLNFVIERAFDGELMEQTSTNVAWGVCFRHPLFWAPDIYLLRACAASECVVVLKACIDGNEVVGESTTLSLYDGFGVVQSPSMPPSLPLPPSPPPPSPLRPPPRPPLMPLPRSPPLPPQPLPPLSPSPLLPQSSYSSLAPAIMSAIGGGTSGAMLLAAAVLGLSTGWKLRQLRLRHFRRMETSDDSAGTSVPSGSEVELPSAEPTTGSPRETHQDPDYLTSPNHDGGGAPSAAMHDHGDESNEASPTWSTSTTSCVLDQSLA